MSRRDEPPNQPHQRSPWGSVRRVADDIDAGPRTVYGAIRRGELKAAAVNGRGDFIIHDDWVRDWLEAKAARVSPLRKVVG